MAENPELSITEIEKLADKNMYLAKRMHYSTKGGDRRGQQQNAYMALCALYMKILMVNLTEDKASLSIIYRRMTDGEFKLVEMEMIPSENYSDDNQNLYLYVKAIDK